MTNRLKGSRLRSVLAAASLVWSCQASAEVDANAFLKMMEEHNWSARTYLMGIVTGLETANNVVQKQLGTRLFCVPQGKAISPELQIAILVDHLSLVPPDRNLPISRVVAHSLALRYPCGL